MKNTIIVGIVLFIVGGLVGFGADRAYMTRKSAVNYEETEQQATESGEGGATTTDPAVENTSEKDSVTATVETANPALGLSLIGQSSAGNSVSVEDQKPGNVVAVRSLAIAVNGWVVIYDDRDGKLAHILGAHRFNAGTYASQNVQLLKATEEGKVYYAVLHTDDGDKKFDYRVDTPVKDQTGNSVMMRFVATSKSAQE